MNSIFIKKMVQIDSKCEWYFYLKLTCTNHWINQSVKSCLNACKCTYNKCRDLGSSLWRMYNGIKVVSGSHGVLKICMWMSSKDLRLFGMSHFYTYQVFDVMFNRHISTDCVDNIEIFFRYHSSNCFSICQYMLTCVQT